MGDNSRASLPTTDPYTPAFDTGAHSAPIGITAPDGGPTTQAMSAAELSGPHELPDLSQTSATSTAAADAHPAELTAPPAQSVTVPGRYYYLKWWKLVLMIAAVWVVAAPIGLGLMYWWYHALNKTPVVFVVLVYVVVSTVGSLMSAMVTGKPLLSALGIAMMSAVFASAAAAAPLYGHYYCEHVSRCLIGVVPY